MSGAPAGGARVGVHGRAVAVVDTPFPEPDEGARAPSPVPGPGALSPPPRPVRDVGATAGDAGMPGMGPTWQYIPRHVSETVSLDAATATELARRARTAFSR
jgi:hypothetical protein